MHKVKESFVVAKQITKRFGDHTALDNVSFSLKQGNIMAVLGPNGSGKTTLARILLGLDEPTEGMVTIDGKPPKQLRGRISYVPQRFAFDRTLPLTVHEFLRLSACIDNKHKAEKVIERSLAEVSIEPLKERHLGQLSGGQFQRVLVARALLHENELIVFDEPVTGIDVQGERQIYDLMVRINKDRGTTIIIITHELDAVLPFSNDVLCVNCRAVCFGPPELALKPEVMQALYGGHAGSHPTH